LLPAQGILLEEILVLKVMRIRLPLSQTGLLARTFALLLRGMAFEGILQIAYQEYFLLPLRSFPAKPFDLGLRGMACLSDAA
jgi:hypothetical protein